MTGIYEAAKEKYARLGVDTERAMALLARKAISVHCWQGDDVIGFDGAGALSGGIQTTGNYPGRARTPEELMDDFAEAIRLIPGKKRINLHASYAIFDGAPADRDALEPKHFEKWAAFAKAHDLGVDFNPTFFSHPKAIGLTLSSPDESIRAFWIRHAIASRRIAAYFARELKTPCLCNVWIPDGMKDVPADRVGPRARLKDSLDQIFAEKLEGVIDSVESKVFGIGLEAYTVGSNEFYMSYAAARGDVYNLLDNGHFHPTEQVADKIPSLLCFFDKVPLHLTRAVRWDSDHVLRLDDELTDICREIVRADAMDRVLIGLDFFDASVNRVAAWVIGARSAQKALLAALLEPHANMKRLQDEGRGTELMMLQEELKTYPMGAVFEEYCARQGVPADESWFARVAAYERETLSKRA